MKGKVHSGRNFLGFLDTEAQEESYWRLMELLTHWSHKEGMEDALSEGPGAMRKWAHLDRLTVAEWMQLESISPLVRQLVDVENRGLFGANNQELSLLYNIPEMA